MKRVFVLVILALFLMPAVALCVGETVTDFTLKDVKGKTFRLGDHLGDKVIVLTFWMTWCKPCMVEMPQLEKLYKKYKKDGLLIVSINGDDPASIPNAKKIVRQKGVTYPVLLDTSTEVVGIYNPNKTFPYTIIIDKDKKVVHVKAGFSAGDEKILENKIEKLLHAGD